MSNSQPEKPKLVMLRVDAHDQPIEIFVINHRFERVAKGTRHLETELEPGIYKVRYKAASLLQEQLVSLEAGSAPVSIEAPHLEFSSPVPLADTRTTHPDHELMAQQHSQQVHCQLGQNSQLFVFVRDWPGEKNAAGDVAAGLSLHDVAGKKLVDFSKEGARDAGNGTNPGWAACNVALAPGAYRLRVNTRAAGVLEQIVVAAPGWQTQVFLKRRAYGRGAAYYADLSEAAILMAHQGAGFNATRDDARQAELARQGLADARAVISPTDLRAIVNGKFQNPMLGLYGAHLLLLQDKPDLALLHIVIGNLRNLLGPHPDVQALELLLDSSAKDRAMPVFEVPPMLRSSWKIVLQNSIAHPEIVPAGSLAAHVAPQIWGSGAWLVYRFLQSASKSETKPLTPQHLRKLLAQLTAKIESDSPESREQWRTSVEKIAQKNGLSDLECDLLNYLGSSLPPTAPLQKTATTKGEKKTKTSFATSTRKTARPGIMMAASVDFTADITDEANFDTAQLPSKTSRSTEKTSPRPTTARQKPIKARLNNTQLVENLGVPTATIEEAAASLIEKLQLDL